MGEILRTAGAVVGLMMVVLRVAQVVQRRGGWTRVRQTGAHWWLALAIASFAVLIYVSSLPPWLPRELRVPLGLSSMIGMGGGLLAFLNRLQRAQARSESPAAEPLA